MPEAAESSMLTMETVNGTNRVTRQNVKTETDYRLKEGITLHLSRWNGLQMAVQNQWGGHDSIQKFHQLAADILSWFSQSNGILFYFISLTFSYGHHVSCYLII